MNASIRGPFLPVYLQAPWFCYFLSHLSGRVKLVGTTSNCLPSSYASIPKTVGLWHVQSMIYAVDNVGLSLIKPILSRCYKDYRSAILYGELELTKVITDAGFKAKTFLLHDNYREFPHRKCEHGNIYDDEAAYFGIDINPFEVMFIKANRGYNGLVLQRYTEWMDSNAS